MAHESTSSTSYSVPRLLIVGQTPPPWHGQAVATKMLFEHDWGRREVQTLRMAYSEEMQAVGRIHPSKFIHLWKIVRETRRILKEQPNTILFYPPASPNWVPFMRDFVYLLLTRKLACKTVLIYHAGGVAEWVHKSKLRSIMALPMYHDADLSLEVAVEVLSPHHLFNAKNWKWSPYGIDVPEVTRQSQGPEKPCRVLFVGSLQEGKGVLEVLKTASILKAKGKNYVFNLVGPWFSEAFEQEAKALANQLGIEDIVKFPGQLIGEDKWKSYADADVFFFPTHYASEAFPIVLIEALGSGLPIVSTRWRGVPSLVEESGVATLCDPQCPEMFVDALEQWHIRAGDARQISFRARSYYNKLYLPKHFLGRIEDELQRLTGSIRDRSTKPFSYETCSENSNPEVTDLRVLQVFNQYAEQGGEEVWVDQVTSLSDERLRVHELRFHSRAWKMQGAPSPFTQARRMWDNPESRRRLSREVKTLKPDALLFHNLIPVGSFGLYDEARKLGVPVIQYIHNFRPFSPSGTLWHGNRVRDEALHGNPWPEVLGRAWERSLPKTALLAFYLRRLQSSGWLDAVDRWIAICDFMRGKFIEAGIPEHKITTLRHCWTPTVAEPLGQDQGYYLFLGRLVPEKGVGTLLKAWQKLELKLGRACPRLVVAGTGPEETKVMGAAAQGEAIEYAGFVSGEAKQRLLAGCRAVLAPSIWWEPLGLVVYEAYDHGKPVIAARSGGLMETVREGDGGSLHSPGDPDSLVEAILQLEETGHAGRVAMGTAGRKWLLQKADPEAWRKSFAGIVEAVRR